MKSLLLIRVGMALAILGLTSPVGLARSEVTLGTAGPDQRETNDSTLRIFYRCFDVILPSNR